MLIMFAALMILFSAAGAETQEQGLEEIQQLAEIAQVDGKEGMSLEEMTNAFSETAMSEYAESTSG